MAVVEAGGVNAAAARIVIARSAVSRRLSEREARLGATLVERSTRRFELTDMGRALFEDSKRVLGRPRHAGDPLHRQSERAGAAERVIGT